MGKYDVQRAPVKVDYKAPKHVRVIKTDTPVTGGLGAIAMPRKGYVEEGPRAGPPVARRDSLGLQGRANATVNLGGDVKGFASTEVPIDIRNAITASQSGVQALHNAIDPKQGSATVGVQDGYNRVTYTKRADSDTVRYSGQNGKGGLGLGYTKGQDGEWKANADILVALRNKQKLNMRFGADSYGGAQASLGYDNGKYSIGGGVDSRGNGNINAGYRSGNFNIGGEANSEGDFKAKLGYRF